MTHVTFLRVWVIIAIHAQPICYMTYRVVYGAFHVTRMVWSPRNIMRQSFVAMVDFGIRFLASLHEIISSPFRSLWVNTSTITILLNQHKVRSKQTLLQNTINRVQPCVLHIPFENSCQRKYFVKMNTGDGAQSGKQCLYVLSPHCETLRANVKS